MPRLSLDTPLIALVRPGRARASTPSHTRPPSTPSDALVPSGSVVTSASSSSGSVVSAVPSGPSLPSGSEVASASSSSSSEVPPVPSGPSLPSGRAETSGAPVSADSCRQLGGDAEIAVAIRARAHVVNRPREYIGLFEFASWCWLRHRNIKLNIGRSWVSLEELHPCLQEHTRGPDQQEPIHIAAAYWDDKCQHWGAVHDAHKHALDLHYLIAFPFGKARSADCYARLDVQLQQMGYMMILTVAQGDCGIDALAYHDNDFIHTSPVEWKRLRNELCKHMLEHAEDPMWQDLFKACGESAEENPGVRNRSDMPELCRSDEEVSEDSLSEAGSFDEYFGLGEETCSATAGAKPAEPLGQPLVRGCAGDEPGAEEEQDESPPEEAKGLKPSSCSAPPQVGGEGASAEPPEPEAQAQALSSSGCVSMVPSGSVSTVPSGSVSTVPSGSVSTVLSGSIAPVAEYAGSGETTRSSSRWGKGGYRNPVRLRDHMRTLDEQTLRRISSSMEAFQAYEKKYFEEHPPPARKRADKETELPTQIRKWNATLHQRMAMGRAYQIWLGTPAGREAIQNGCQRRCFIVAGTGRSPSDVSKAETQRLCRAWELVLQQDLLEGRLDAKKDPVQFAFAEKLRKRTEARRGKRGETETRAKVHLSVGHGMAREAGGMFRRVCSGGLPHKYRRRQLRFQGRPFKCPALREELYDWVVNMRSIFAKIPPGLLKKQALVIAKKVWRLSREQNIWPQLPRITYQWVRGWRREWKVSLRRPNAKFKLSKQKLYLRLRHVWRANLSIRWLAHFCLHRQLIVWGCDQKPIYMNEGGHKNQPTCHFEGAELAVAKDNIAQSRARVSIMTTVTSDKAEAQSSLLPIGVCFRAKTEKILANLPKSLGKHVLFQVAPKGSYRVEHVVQFLQRALPAWTEERAAAKDWRILYLDAYAAHFAQDVVECAWAHGFVVLWHGAGTTGLLQVNDTHLHASFERIYLDMEAESFAHQQFWDPTDISRHRGDVVGDVASTWAALDHACAAKGHVSNGLTHDLEGREDVCLSRDVREAWVFLEGPKMSQEIGADICAKVAAGEYRWDWETIQLLSGRNEAERHLGAYATEGQELEAAQQEGEAVFEDEAAQETEEEREELKEARTKRRKCKSTAEASGPSHVIEGTVVPARDSDTEAAKRVAEAFAEKRRVVEEVRNAAKGEEWAPTRWNCDRKLQVLLKSYCPGLRVQQEGEDLVRRYMAAEAAVEGEKRQKAIEEARKRRRVLEKQKVIKKKLQNEAEARKLARQKEQDSRKEAEAAREAAKALMERRFSLGELKPQRAKGSKALSRQARLDFLDRLRLVYGISSAVEMYWSEFREWYVDWIVRPAYKPGPQAMIDLNERLEASAFRAKSEGRVSRAFDIWVRETRKSSMRIVEPATTATLPGGAAVASAPVASLASAPVGSASVTSGSI